MARFLFIVPPLVGHVNPAVSVALELEARGHVVAWVGHPRTVRPLLPEGAKLFALDDDLPVDMWTQASSRSRALRGLEALKFLWEEFLIPLARAMKPGVEAAIDDFAPNALVVDQQAVAGALVARRRGLRWATFATTSAGLTDPLAGLPRVREWLESKLAELEREAGLLPSPRPDCSPELVIAFTTEALVGEAELPQHVHFVGPAVMKRPEPTPFPWEAFRRRPRVLITLGTVNAEAGGRFHAVAIEALGARPGIDAPEVVLVARDAAQANAPDNFIVRDYVPQLALLSHVDAVVCHAGQNTVCETLAHGLPLVVLPIKDDQPVIAEQVVRAGAGIRLKFGRVRAEELRDAVNRVLGEPSFREAATRIQRSFVEAGGSPRAAILLEKLL